MTFSCILCYICGMKTVHIYAISLADGRAYVGSTFNTQQRQNAHYALLRRNAHHSPRLQNAWNKYGENAFSFSVLETAICRDIHERTALEAKWAALYGQLNTARSTNGITFNKSKRFMDKLQQTLERRHADPQARNRLGEWIKTDEGSAWIRSRNREWWSKPENRERMQQKAKDRCTAEFMAKCRANGAGRQTEAVREQRKERMTMRMADPVERERMRIVARTMMIERGIRNVEHAVSEQQPLTRSLIRTGRKHLARLSPEAAAAVSALATRLPNQRARGVSGRFQSRACLPPFAAQSSED